MQTMQKIKRNKIYARDCSVNDLTGEIHSSRKILEVNVNIYSKITRKRINQFCSF